MSRTIFIFDARFEVDWQSTDYRVIADRERALCYELVFFDGFDHDRDRMRGGLPTTIEKRWLPNPNYKRNAPREQLERLRVGDTKPVRPEAGGYYLPPEAREVRFIDPRNPELPRDGKQAIRASLALTEIAKQAFDTHCSGPASGLLSKPGIVVFVATFKNGDVMFLKNVLSRSMPDEAKAYWQTMETKQRVGGIIEETTTTKGELDKTKATLHKAQQVANLNIQEAVSHWNQLHIPNVDATTKAKIKEAVTLYLVDADNRSLSKIGDKFGVTKQRVSQWFKIFTEATGVPVVVHKRNESVKSHLQRAKSEQLPPKPTAKQGSNLTPLRARKSA